MSTEGALRPVRRRVAALVLCSCSYLLLAALANLPAWIHGAGSVLPRGNGVDPNQGAWFLTSGAALAVHGLNPFLTSALNAPAGVNLMENTGMLVPGILLAPVNWLFGPVATYNTALVLGIAGSATAAMLVLRRWTRWLPAAYLGGLLYGFSPFIAAQGQDHVNFVLVAIPPLVLLTLDEILVRQRGSAARWGCLLGVLAAVQLLSTSEILAEMAVLSVIGVLLLAVACRRQLRAHLPHAAGALGWAAAVFLLIAAYPLWLVVAGPNHVTGPFQGNLPSLSADLTSPLVPTGQQLLAPPALAHTGDAFVAGDQAENGSYLGLALVAVLAVMVIRLRRVGVVRFSAAMIAVAFVLSLGPTLHVDNRSTGIPLPEGAIAKLPLFENLVPARFALYVVLFASVIFAVGLDRLRARARPVGAMAVPPAAAAVGVAALCLVPLLPAWPYAMRTVHIPPYFHSPAAGGGPPGTVTLVYPVAREGEDAAMLWQAASGLAFSMPGGYVIAPGPGGRAEQPAAGPLGMVLAACTIGDPPLRLAPSLAVRLRQQLGLLMVHTVAVARGSPGHRCATGLFTALLGPPSAARGGMLLWGPPWREAGRHE